MSKNEKLSKFLSLVLRHKPEAIGLRLDAAGWANIQELVRLAGQNGTVLSEALISEVVETNSKQRFAISDDGRSIRANQGHSVNVELGLTAIEPPETLFHGTAERFIESILALGLSKGSRNHVHLSADIETAVSVGRRYGKPVVLLVDSGKMHRDGNKFFRSENGVWLTDAVSVKYIVVSWPNNSLQADPP